MTEGVVVAIVAAWPPTVAATLTFLAARAADRRASVERAAATAQSLEALGASVERVEAVVGRVESGVGELRERVARLEGASDAAVRAIG
jgi:phage shock protein A